MEDKTFTQLMSNMSILIKGCHHISNLYHRQRITPATIVRARTIQGFMDKIFMTEIYHIITMGNLTIAQTEKFNDAVKRLGKYRPIIKYIATMQEIDCGHAIAEQIRQSKYKSLLTGTILEGGR